MARWVVEVDFGHDYGVARASVALHNESQGRHIRFAAVSASGDSHDAREDDRPISGKRTGHEYKDARSAMAAALRRVADDIERDWSTYAAEHGTGAR